MSSSSSSASSVADDDARAPRANARRNPIKRTNVSMHHDTLSAAQGGLCALCGGAIDDSAQVDHVVELALLGDVWRRVKSGGPDAAWHAVVAHALTLLANGRNNLRLLCRQSHDRKSTLFAAVRKDLKKSFARGTPVARAAAFADDEDDWLPAVAADARRFAARVEALDVAKVALAERGAARGALKEMAAVVGALFSDDSGVV